MELFIKIIQVIFAFSLLVLVHEFGHFLFAKLFKIRVEKFYMFFNPQMSLMKVKKFNGKLHFQFFAKNIDALSPDSELSELDDNDWRKYPEQTEYGIGWLPMGGYCAIGGMIDETKNADKLCKEPQPWEFRTKPAWQRFLVMFGGVFFNFILAIFLYGAILQTWGEQYLKNENATYGIAVNDLAYEIGFRNGDRILSFDGEPIDDFAQLQVDLIRSQATSAKVLREGDTITVRIDPNYIPAMLKSPGMFEVAFPFIVSSLAENSPNINSGLQNKDAVVGINGEYMFLVQDIQNELQKHKEDSILASVNRGGDVLAVPLAVDTAGMIGVMLENDFTKFFNVTENEYTFLEALPAGTVRAFNYIKNYVKELGLIFSPKTEAYKSVGSFISIGRVFPGTWDWYKVWSLTAMLSIMLAVLNLVPIPGLDGGHILFLIVEMLTGYKFKDKAMEIAQSIGMILLFGLMILAFGNDIKSLF